jgi:hypothetical protein
VRSVARNGGPVPRDKGTYLPLFCNELRFRRARHNRPLAAQLIVGKCNFHSKFHAPDHIRLSLYAPIQIVVLALLVSLGLLEVRWRRRWPELLTIG